MRTVLTLLSLLLAVAACHERPGVNDLVIRSVAKVGVGTPVYRGATVVGHVVRARARGDQVQLTFRFEPDSAAPASLTELRIKSTSLGSASAFYIVPPPVIPVFGSGGYIPGAAAPRR
jgi:hypothetical protein